MRKIFLASFAVVLASSVWMGSPLPAVAESARAFARKPENLRITKGPVVEWVGEKDAVIAWSTNVRASTALRYGTEKASLSHTAKAPWAESTHRIHLRDLTPSTTYYFIADSAQAQGSGSHAATGEGTITTVLAGHRGKQYPNGRP